MACVLALSVSCTKQDTEPGGAYNGSTARVPISLQSVGNAVSGDGEIRTVRLIFFTPAGKLVSNWLHNIQPGDDPSLVTGEMAIGMNDIYVICNETTELGRDLADVTRPEQIAGIRFTPPLEGISDPVPMFCHLPDVKIERGNGSAVNVTVNGTTTPYLEVTVTRIVARLGMTVIKNVPPDGIGFSVEKLSYRLCHVPAYSMLAAGAERYAQGEGWGPEITVAGEGRIDAGSNGDYQVSGDVCTVPAGLDAIRFPVVYIPEHRPQSPENPDYCTYLLIEADCVTEYSSSPVRSVYRVNLGKMPPADLDIERNVNYQVYVKITGLGATGFYAEILPVEEYDLPITWKPSEGYAIVGERVEDYGVNTNIWNSYSQYSGILKIVSGTTYSDACFRYGSIVALSSTAAAGAFDPAADVLWMPGVTKADSPVSSWDDVKHMTSEDVSGTTHTLENIRLGKGDPCRLVGLSESEIASGTIDNKLWRLPTKSEMQWLATARNSTADARGFYSFSYLLTPFNGYRTETGMMVPSDATAGHYWSATAANSFSFGADNTSAIAADTPGKAYAVRCLRTDIPTSVFNVSGFNINYLGGTGNISGSVNNVLTPYWRMEIADAASAAQISLAKTEGSSKESNPVTVQPLPEPYKKAEYTVKVTGYGLDGQVHERIATIAQRALYHDVTISWTSTPELGQAEGYYRIPTEGATLSFTMQITPEPLAPYNPGFDDKLWRIRCKYYTDVLTTVYGTPAKRGEASVITFPANTWGHILGMEFDMVPVDLYTYPPHTSQSTILIQNVN